MVDDAVNPALQQRFVAVIRIAATALALFTVKDLIKGDPRAAATVGSGFLCSCLLLAAIHRNHSAKRLTNSIRFACLIATFCIGSNSLFTTQSQSPAPFFIIVVAIFTADFLTLREALIWTVFASIVAVAGVLSERFMLIPPAVPRNDIDRAFEVTALVGLVFGCMWSIRSRMNEQMRQLDLRAETLRRQSESLQVARDEALAATAVKSRFLAHMSHEIRTPLNGVIGMADVLGAIPEKDAETTRIAHTIRQSGKSLLNIVNDILDYSKLDSDGMKLSERKFYLHECIEASLQIFENDAWNRKIDLNHRIDPDVSRVVMGDPQRLQQILVNLVSNALKFTKEGSVYLNVEARSDDFLEFSVTDSGVGIKIEDQESLFDEFTQVDGNNTQKGTGLGLAISRQLVDLMKGELSVTSTPGRGSTFRFTAKLPAVRTESIPPATQRFIIASPSVEAQESSKAALQRFDQKVVCVSSLVDLTAALSEPTDTCIVSARFGAALNDFHALRAKYPKTRFLLLTSFADTLIRPNAEALGFDSAITKPVKVASLLPQSNAVPAMEEATTFPRRRILVGEDDATNRLVIDRMLQLLDCDVTFAHDGLQVVDRVRRESFDLVLMDVNMPNMNGLEATQEIRTFAPTLKIVALTASVLEEQRQACLKAGMNAFLEKPLQLARLRALLQESAPSANTH